MIPRTMSRKSLNLLRSRGASVGWLNIGSEADRSPAVDSRVLEDTERNRAEGCLQDLEEHA